MEQYSYMFFVALAMGSVFSVLVYRQYKKEKNGEFPYEERSRYPAILSPYRLPIYACALLIVGVLPHKDKDFLTSLFLEVFSVFLHISLYHAVLLLVMPLLRKKISARVCALLWTIPSLFYIVLYSHYEGLLRPWLVIPLPKLPVMWLCVIWGIGFTVVMLWKVFTHLWFRKWILTSSVAVEDPIILQLWEEEQMAAKVWKGYKTDLFRIPLVQSEHITTPLSIGLRRNSLYVVLPKKHYTEEEYRWIFRHELVHIGREDSGNKFLLAFCTAMCWFNPIMWFAMRQCASDLERSCDETVLLNADTDAKKQYAYLLLKTAGDDRGFTTCLSASGASMRHRLESALGTSKQYVGSLVAGVCVFAMIFGYGTVTMAYETMSAEEAIYQHDGSYVLYGIGDSDQTESSMQLDRISESLRQYLREQTVYRLTNEYNRGSEQLVLRYGDPHIRVTLYDQMMEIFYFQEDTARKYYYFAEPLDWSYLYELVGIEE